MSQSVPSARATMLFTTKPEGEILLIRDTIKRENRHRAGVVANFCQFDTKTVTWEE